MNDVLRSKKFWVEGLIMTFGMLVAAVAVHFFLIPSKLIVGSVTGLSIVISRLSGLPVDYIIFAINAVLLILSYVLIGKEFGLKTVYTALILAPWLRFLETFFPLKESIMQDPWFDLLCFVLLLSASQAILFKINASTGGLDILAKIINKYLHINLATAVTVAGVAICSTAFLINDVRLVIMGLLGTWINGLVLNHFMTGMSSKKRVCIISKEYEKLRDYIVAEIERGVTLYEVIGGYSNEKMMELEVLLTRDEFARLMKYISKEQISSFITAGTVSEVYGLWSHKKKKKRRLL